MPSWAYTNDADGNTLTGGGRTNTWDSQNRLVSCVYNGTTSTFTYGADGLRRQATVNGVTTDYVYDGQTLIREGHASGGTLTAATVTAMYLAGPGSVRTATSVRASGSSSSLPLGFIREDPCKRSEQGGGFFLPSEA